MFSFSNGIFSRTESHPENDQTRHKTRVARCVPDALRHFPIAGRVQPAMPAHAAAPQRVAPALQNHDSASSALIFPFTSASASAGIAPFLLALRRRQSRLFT